MSDNVDTVDKAIADYNEKQALEKSLISRIDVLTAKIKGLVTKLKSSGTTSPSNLKEAEAKPKKEEPPIPVPEPGESQVLPLLFGLAFILIKIMNQKNLNKQSIYNMNNYFDYMTYMIQIYQKVCNSAVTKNYPLKKDLLINSLKSFYAYFYMAVSEKMQELFKGANYPDGIDWISTLDPVEDKKLASIEFMNVIDTLFKDIHPAFVYMIEDFQLTDSATIASMKPEMTLLNKINSAKGEDSAASSSPDTAAASTDAAALGADLSANPAAALGALSANPAAALGALSANPAGALDALKANPAASKALGALSANPAAAKALGALSANPAAALGALKANPAAALGALKANPAAAKALGSLKANPGAAAMLGAFKKRKGGAYNTLYGGDPTATSEEESDSPKKEKESIIFPKTLVPDECKLTDTCKRDAVDELKSIADEQTVQLKRLLEEGLTTIKDGPAAINIELGKLAFNASEIRISMIKQLEPPAAVSKEAIQKIITEIRSLMPPILANIDKRTNAFVTASTQADAKPFAEEMLKELGKLKDTLIDVPKFLDKMDTSTPTSNQIFQELLQKIKTTSTLLEQNPFDEKKLASIKEVNINLIKTIDESKASMPGGKVPPKDSQTLKTPPGPTGTTFGPTGTTFGPTGTTPGPTGTTPGPTGTTPGPTGTTPGPTSATLPTTTNAQRNKISQILGTPPIPPQSKGVMPGSLVAQRGLPPLVNGKAPELADLKLKDEISNKYKNLTHELDNEFVWIGPDDEKRMGVSLVNKLNLIHDDFTNRTNQIKGSGITIANKPILDDLGVSVKQLIEILKKNKIDKTPASIKLLKDVADVVSIKLNDITKLPGLKYTAVGGARTLRRSKRKITKTKKTLRRSR